jgi:glycosyltransferase involved in cell wall biosynthesis
LRKPKHVIIQFIMREKTQAFASRLKYLLMKIMFISLHKAICSARPEVVYYLEAFGWARSKASFVPLSTASRLLEHAVEDTSAFIFAGGRVYRDYDTLVRALAGAAYRTIVVSDRDHPEFARYPNIETHRSIPLDEFYGLLAQSRVVVLPLEDRPFSVGQTVLLEAMAMGKPVIATRTAGTIDYIDDYESGILVEPNDANALREAIELLMTDEQLRSRMSESAKHAVINRYLPHHYARAVREVLFADQKLGNPQRRS